MANEQEQRAMDYVRRKIEEKGIEVISKQCAGVGYDYEFKYPDGKIEKIEVKGSKKPYKIPDMRVSEFDENKHLKADFLYVIGNIFEEGKEVVCIIRREEIPPEKLKPLETYRITKFQSERNMKNFKVDL